MMGCQTISSLPPAQDIIISKTRHRHPILVECGHLEDLEDDGGGPKRWGNISWSCRGLGGRYALAESNLCFLLLEERERESFNWKYWKIVHEKVITTNVANTFHHFQAVFKVIRITINVTMNCILNIKIYKRNAAYYYSVYNKLCSYRLDMKAIYTISAQSNPAYFKILSCNNRNSSDFNFPPTVF